MPSAQSETTGLKPNSQPLGREAFRWLQEAKASPDPAFLYLSQLAHWGLEKGVQVKANKIEPYVLEDQVNLLLGHQQDPNQEQENANHWLLSNPNGPPKAEQASTLLKALKGAQDPLEAAAAVLETVSDRMAAANVTYPD